MSKTALVTGGAGYIGSHCALYLAEAGWKTIVLDDLSLGHRNAVIASRLAVGNTGDAALLDRVFTEHRIDAVLHFAAFSKVGESMEYPAMYYRNNVVNGLALLEAMARHKVGNLVFSSTAAVYGEPVETPITEDHPTAPINPYGSSKLMFERMTLDMAAMHGPRAVFLRYFNAAGADPEGRLGEDHRPETHLIPIALQAALGARESLSIYGADYPTPDGTCVRDYIHIHDLAAAHIKALEYLGGGGETAAFNLGNGQGHSVREVVDTVRKVTGKPLDAVEAPRRPGDPAVLIASSEKAQRVLGWRPRYPGLDAIVDTAHRWATAHPEGYGS